MQAVKTTNLQSIADALDSKKFPTSANAVKLFKQNIDGLNTAIEELKKITDKERVDNDAYQAAVAKVDECNAEISKQLNGPDKHLLHGAFSFPNADKSKPNEQESARLFALTKQLAEIDAAVTRMHSNFNSNRPSRDETPELSPDSVITSAVKSIKDTLGFDTSVSKKIAEEFGFTHKVWNEEKKKFETLPINDSKGNPINLTREEAVEAVKEWNKEEKERCKTSNTKFVPATMEDNFFSSGWTIHCGDKHRKMGSEKRPFNTSVFAKMEEVQNKRYAAVNKQSVAPTVIQSQPTTPAPAPQPAATAASVTQSQPEAPTPTPTTAAAPTVTQFQPTKPTPTPQPKEAPPVVVKQQPVAAATAAPILSTLSPEDTEKQKAAMSELKKILEKPYNLINDPKITEVRDIITSNEHLLDKNECTVLLNSRYNEVEYRKALLYSEIDTASELKGGTNEEVEMMGRINEQVKHNMKHLNDELVHPRELKTLVESKLKDRLPATEGEEFTPAKATGEVTGSSGEEQPTQAPTTAKPNA